MTCFPDLSHRMTQLVTITVCVSALWLSTSCGATNRNETEIHTLQRSTQYPASRFIPHEVLVKFKGGVSQERIAFILNDNRIGVITEMQRGRLYHVRIPDDRSVESAISRLNSYPEVEYAEPNYRYETQK